MFKGSVASDDLDEVVRALKAAAEPTRLRLLFLLRHGEFTVGELCTVLDQSQPRISRHLRLLTEAGFLDRFREQQCVYYRVPTAGRNLAWLRQVLAMADPDAPLLRRDREHAAEVTRDRARTAAQQLPAATKPASDELASVVLEELGPASVGELLDIGTGSGKMLEVLAPRASRAVGVDISAPALRMARTRIHGAGLAHCEFRRGDMYDLPCEDACFDTVTMDRVLASATRPAAAIGEAARALRAAGRLIIIEDFDQIEIHGAKNPLARLREWLAVAGLSTLRLRPCDLPGGHLVVALAAHRAPEPA